MTDLDSLRAELHAEQARISMDKNHRYRVDGKAMPNVTTIIGVLDAPQLDAWKVRVQVEGTARAAHDNPPAFGEPEGAYVARLLEIAKRQFEHERLSEAAANIGKQVHALIEHAVKRMLGEIGPSPQVSDEALFVFAGWREWADRSGFQPFAAEARVANRGDGYCGTLDLLAIVDGRPAVIDWKTAPAVYPNMRLQSAAYRMALRSAGWPELDGYVVRLPKDGGDIASERLEAGAELDAAYESFRACLSLYRWLASTKRVRKAEEPAA